MAPTSFRAAQRMGAAWPLESTKTSWSFPLGSFGSRCISSKKRTDTISAHDMQLVGWPEPASVVDSSEWRRSFCAMVARVALSTGMGGEGSPLRREGSSSMGRAEPGAVGGHGRPAGRVLVRDLADHVALDDRAHAVGRPGEGVAVVEGQVRVLAGLDRAHAPLDP